MNRSDISRSLREVLQPVVAGADLYLEEVSVTGAGKQRRVQIVVDLPDGPGGVDSEALGDLSRDVSNRLDADEDLLPGPYLLEVTTPGVDRSLTEPRHFRRAQGRLVSVTTAQEDTIRGRVVDAADDGLHLEPPARKKSESEPILLPWSEVGEGRIEVEFNPPKDSGS